MKTFKTSIFAAVLLSVMVLAACKKNSSTPKPASATSQLAFQMQAVNNSSNLATNSLATSSIAGLTWTAGMANISKFVFEAQRNGVTINVTSRNADSVNLFTVNPTVTYITLDTGVYKEIEIKVYLEPTSDTSHLPLKLTGTFTNDSSKVIPIELDLNSDVTISAEADNVHITGITDYVALVQMELPKLTAGVTAADLNSATLTNGKIIISKTSNTSIYWKIKSDFADCGHSEFREHHRDDDH
jgi:hypothetical protein